MNFFILPLLLYNTLLSALHTVHGRFNLREAPMAKPFHRPSCTFVDPLYIQCKPLLYTVWAVVIRFFISFTQCVNSNNILLTKSINQSKCMTAKICFTIGLKCAQQEERKQSCAVLYRIYNDFNPKTFRRVRMLRRSLKPKIFLNMLFMAVCYNQSSLMRNTP